MFLIAFTLQSPAHHLSSPVLHDLDVLHRVLPRGPEGLDDEGLVHVLHELGGQSELTYQSTRAAIHSLHFNHSKLQTDFLCDFATRNVYLII